MSKKEKNKKDNKNKKKTSSFFSNLNSDNKIEYGYAEKNPKSKWAKWSIIGLLGAATVTGVAVPWALGSCSVSWVKPYNDLDVLYNYIDPSTGEVVSVTYKEFSDRIENIQTTVTIFDKWDDVFYNSVLKSIYDEEREAFLKFKAIYEKLHGKDKLTISNFGADLSSSFQDIEEDKRKILNENKKSFQKAWQNKENWQQLWFNELQTNSIYGPQVAEANDNIESLEQKALDYMVGQQIKESALARYRGASISSNSWTEKDYIFAYETILTNGNGDQKYTEYKDNNNQTQEIKLSDAVNIWKKYLAKDQNVFVPKSTSSSTSDSESKKIYVFETKSYSTEFRNPVGNDNLINILKSFKIGLVSSFDITSITPSTELNGSPFVVSQEALISLFKIQNSPNSTFTNFIPIANLSKYQGANAINYQSDNSGSLSNNALIQNEKDSLLVNTFNTSEDKISNLGSSKLTDITSLIGNTDTSSSDSSSEETSVSEIAKFNFFAYLSSDNTNTKTTDTQTQYRFSVQNINPFNELMKILFNSFKNSNTTSLVLGDYQTIWDKLGYNSNISTNYPSLKNLITFLYENINETTFEFKGNQNINLYNQDLENRINSLTSSDLTLIGQILNCIFIGTNQNLKVVYEQTDSPNQYGYWTLYKLSGDETNKTYLYVSPTGLKVFTTNYDIVTLENMQHMVMNDLMKTTDSSSNSSSDTSSDSSSDSEDSSSSNLIYDVANIFSKINNDNLIKLILLSKEGNEQIFKDSIIEQLNLKNETNDENNTTEQEVVAEATEILNSYKATSLLEFKSSIEETNLNIMSNVEKIITSLVDSKRVYDFGITLDDNQEQISIFQTTNNYGNDALLKTQKEIVNKFIEQTLKLLEMTNPTLSNKFIKKGGK